MSQAIEKYKNAQKAVAEARKAAEKIVKTAFDEALKELFADNPALISFSWKQYTPYFNDGDECTFSVHTDYGKIEFTAKDGKVVEYDSGDEELTAGGESYNYDTPEYNKYSEEGDKIGKITSDFVNIFAEEDMKSIFGDHAEITAKQKGTTVEEHSHD